MASKTESAFLEILAETMQEEWGLQVEKLPDGSLRVRQTE